LADNTKITVFVVGQSNLPPNAQILLGIEHIKDLRISVDFAIDRPFCQLEEAMAYREASLARFSSLVSLSAEKEGPRSSLFASEFLDDSLAVTPIRLLMGGLCLSLFAELCLSLMGPHFAALAVSFAGMEVHPAHLFIEVSLLLGLSLVLWRGFQFPRRHRAFRRDPTRANCPRVSSRLSPDVKGCVARMHARDFVSIFSPPQPSPFRRAESCSYGGGGGPASWPRNVFDPGWCEPRALRSDRLGGIARAARFGKFRAKGSSRVPLLPPSYRGLSCKLKTKGSSRRPLPSRRHHGGGPNGLGFRRDPHTGIWRNITSGVSAEPTKRPTQNPANSTGTKRTKPNPSLSVKTKRSPLQNSKTKTTTSKRAKPAPPVPSSIPPPQVW
jgi:hypothetical protein